MSHSESEGTPDPKTLFPVQVQCNKNYLDGVLFVTRVLASEINLSINSYQERDFFNFVSELNLHRNSFFFISVSV